jgi:hypothetical protein
MMRESRLIYGVGKGDEKSLMEFMGDSVRKSKASQKAQQMEQQNGNLVAKAGRQDATSHSKILIHGFVDGTR